MSSDFDYQAYRKKTIADGYKLEAQMRAIREKKAERQAIKKAGGGQAIAKKLMERDTDFNFGNNAPEQSEDIDRRIEAEAAGRCMGRVMCQICKKFHGYCIEVQEEKEKYKMLPSGDGTSKSNTRKGGLDFLTIDDLSTQPQEVKILMVRYNENGQWGPTVMLKTAFKGSIKYVSIKPTKKDPRYKLLLDHFGPDENNWVDQRFLVMAEKDEFTEAFRMKFDLVAPAKGKK